MASLVSENVKVAFASIKSQALRTVLTIVIIAFGIMALVAILSLIDIIKSSINSNFSNLGANTFTIRNRETSVKIGRGGKKPKKYRSISYEEAMKFKKDFNFPATVSVSTMASFSAKLSYGSKKSNPNIQVFGSDENYILASGYELEDGRNFSETEIISGTPLVVIGQEIKTTFFNEGESPVNKTLRIGSGKYKIIGVLKAKGSSMGFGGDKICVIPIQNARQYFSVPNATFTINVLCNNIQQMNIAIGEATGIFRQIRGVELPEGDNFEISKSDSIANMLNDKLHLFNLGATVLGFIILLGSAVGLMNIMLVSVTERTKEIGIRKALGATQKTIRNQFLMESIVICLLGGVFGILFGIIIGNGLSLGVFKIGFYMPWHWIGGGVAMCVFVGTISGIIPARRAARLDPIESLRYE
ncbi:MAG: FtsX-like permease family protein [Bacteroidetes bacterium]|jgi:putative ABC transport system permease protein|nr:FtsX-like permease family protein [Bacteroidota bacterium]